MSPISAIRSLPNLEGVAPAAASMQGPGGITTEQFEKLASAIDGVRLDPAGRTPTAEFSDVLGQMVRDVQARQAAASTAMTGVLTGQGVPLHEAVLASEEASVSFQLMVEVRNKLLESYQELMRMQV